MTAVQLLGLLTALVQYTSFLNLIAHNNNFTLTNTYCHIFHVRELRSCTLETEMRQHCESNHVLLEIKDNP